MKRFLLAVAAVTLVASSCKKAPEPISNVTDEKDTVAIQEQIFTDHITVNKAAELISNFLTTESFLRNMGITRALGGTFSVTDFPEFSISDDTVSGVNMWFCYSANNVNRPSLSMGIERIPNLNVFPTAPTSNVKIPGIGATFTYPPGAKTDTTTIINYLKTSSTPINVASISLPRAETQRYMREFNVLHSSNRPRTGGKFCDLPFSFFQNNTIIVNDKRISRGLNAFLTQPGTKHIRYYFGYEKDNLGRQHNKIRLILFAVDSIGKNIID
jgi:hypothetical protein